MSEYISVTELIKELKEPFDIRVKALKKAKRNLSDRGEKLTQVNIDEEVALILADWEKKRERGVMMHEKLVQKELKKPNTIFSPKKGGKQKADCKLENRKIYLEKLLISEKYKILGYADKIVIERGAINIYDTKIVDHIYRTSSFTTDNGFKLKSIKMFEPLEYLDDCNYNEYNLQLSLYMYLAWENNKKLKIGKLYIRHIKMNDSDKIVTDELIEVPYLKKEVKNILKYRKLNES